MIDLLVTALSVLFYGGLWGRRFLPEYRGARNRRIATAAGVSLAVLLAVLAYQCGIRHIFGHLVAIAVIAPFAYFTAPTRRAMTWKDLYGKWRDRGKKENA